MHMLLYSIYVWVCLRELGPFEMDLQEYTTATNRPLVVSTIVVCIFAYACTRACLCLSV